MPQLIVNILLTVSVYLITAQSFLLIYQTSKFFNIAHAAIITFGAYFTFTFSQILSFHIIPSIALSVFISILIGVGTEFFVFRFLRKKNNHPYIMLISSLGIYIVFQNLILIIWGSQTKLIRPSQVNVGNEFFGAYITDIQISTIIIVILLFTGTIVFLNKINLGKQMRAVSSNRELANIFGIKSNNVILYSFGIGSGLAAIAGILVAFDTDMIPTMGFNLLLYGVVTMIIGGIGSTGGLIAGSLLLASAQHLGAYYIDSIWMDTIAYIILILFLIWKPLGFSGKRLKKIEL
ncbi:MAG: branched-chain amino acid ABC transporter permease [Bacteroidales bacterium]|nr:branched-chain amino acid ABC transporter permease [Bacteroidales bacterium]